MTRKTTSDKILHDKAFHIARIPKYDGYQRGMASTVYKYFDKKTVDGPVKNENMLDQWLAEELHKPVIGQIKQRKVYSSFINNIWVADLDDMQLISKFNNTAQKKKFSIRDLDFYYVLLIFSVITLGLFL